MSRRLSLSLHSPPARVLAFVQDIMSRHFDPAAALSLTKIVPKAVVTALEAGLARMVAGDDPFHRHFFAPAVTAIEKSLASGFSDFVLSPVFSRMMRSHAHLPSREKDDESRLSTRIKCSKQNRYGKWQGRAVRFNMRTAELLIYSSPDSSSVAHSYPLLSIACIQRLSTDGSVLRLQFRSEALRSYELRFDSSTDREQFCIMAHVLSTDLQFTEEWQWITGA